MDHFIHYLPRIIQARQPADVPDEAPFYALPQSAANGFLRPALHVTRQRGYPVPDIREGSTIWIFSAIKSPWGMLAPCLDAKIVVDRIEKDEYGVTTFHAGDASQWYPMHDATKLLQAAWVIHRNYAVKPLWSDTLQPISMYLQSIKRLKSAGELEEWAEYISRDELYFISYRIKDGTSLAFRYARHLLQSGKTVFWDRFCLPRRLVERREQVADDALDSLLMHFIGQSNTVCGIMSKLYEEPGCYAQKEAALASQKQKFKAITSDVFTAND